MWDELVGADMRDHCFSHWWEWQAVIYFVVLFINHSHLHLVCRSPSLRNVGARQFKTCVAWKCVSHPGRYQASDACRVVGAESQGVCLDQGLNFL